MYATTSTPGESDQAIDPVFFIFSSLHIFPHIHHPQFHNNSIYTHIHHLQLFKLNICHFHLFKETPRKDEFSGQLTGEINGEGDEEKEEKVDNHNIPVC
ncbi:hypothetical protein L2E82_39343 [Cichorium intybus]|uniref:Uncharacterized protein n=1 Tax=Cichorium intybus TaxID=13427 RepID=A0ACB9AHF3_CICIN|nr:hypothetical protein L2E82_39343 [Cichorium intybus]